MSATTETLDSDEVRRWLADARAGSSESLGQLLQVCRLYLLGVARNQLESDLRAKGGASDVVQEAFLEAQRVFGRFQGETKEELLAWLRAILLNKLDDFARRYLETQKRHAGKEQPLSADDATSANLADKQPSPSATFARSEELERVMAAVEKLPEEYRNVIYWRQWDDLPFEAIGRRLGKSADAARMIWWRAVEKLERVLESKDDATGS